MWQINEKTKKLLRKYSFILTSEKHNHQDRVKIFYILLRPQLKWMEETLAKNVEKDEIDSILYLMVDSLIKNYDSHRSSIIPYLGISLPWAASSVLKNIEKFNVEEPYGLNPSKGSYKYPSEIYLRQSNVLFMNKWLLRDLQKCYKYLIYRVLASDQDITYKELANDGGLGRTETYYRISELRDILRERGLGCNSTYVKTQ